MRLALLLLACLLGGCSTAPREPPLTTSPFRGCSDDRPFDPARDFDPYGRCPPLVR